MYWSYSLKMKHYKNTRSCLCILALFLINLIEMSQILVTSTYKGIIRYQTYHLFWVISDTCTLSNSFAIPWLHVAYQAPLSMGFFRKEYWSRLSFPPPGDLPHPVIKLTTSVSPELAGRFFTHWATSEALSATSVQFSSVTQSCLTLCDHMNRSTPGLPVHHHLPEFTQTHVHRVSDAIQPSHPLPFPFPPTPNPSQHQSLFQRDNSLHDLAKVLEFQL